MNTEKFEITILFLCPRGITVVEHQTILLIYHNINLLQQHVDNYRSSAGEDSYGLS